MNFQYRAIRAALGERFPFSRYETYAELILSRAPICRWVRLACTRHRFNSLGKGTILAPQFGQCVSATARRRFILLCLEAGDRRWLYSSPDMSSRPRVERALERIAQFDRRVKP